MALLIQPKVVKELASMPGDEWQRLRERLEVIARDPHGRHANVERMQGQDGYRVRQGNWRAIYTINAQGDVEVIRVGHRREVYR
jgi:mRNA interferase RelE/StbE